MRKICMLVLSMLMVGQTAVLNTKAAEEEEKTKSNSQIACESNGGVWNLELGTCTDGKAESEDIDDIQLKSNSQIACEDNGGSWILLQVLVQTDKQALVTVINWMAVMVLVLQL